MNLIEFKGVRNSKKVNAKLDKILPIVETNGAEALIYGGEILRDRAIENLKNLAKQPGLSIDGQSIVDTSNWNINKIRPLHVDVECLSNHAAIVEFGGTKDFIESWNYGHKGWPIGKQQGNTIIKRNKVRLQSGYHYFESAYNSKWVKDSIRNRISRSLWGSLRRI